MSTSRKPDSQDKNRGREIVRLRKALGLSQEYVAEKLGISARQYGKYERGQSQMSLRRYEAIRQVLGEHTRYSDGFDEAQTPYSASLPPKDLLLKKLRGLQDDVEFCIEVVERL